MELAGRRRRYLVRHATNVDARSSGTNRRTRSTVKMVVDSVETSVNTLPDHHQHQDEQQQQQQQVYGVEADVTTEDTTTETASTDVDQTPICVTEQSHRDDVAATTSDSIVENVVDADDSNNEDACAADVCPVDDNAETKSPTSSATGRTETARSLTPGPPWKSSEDAEMSSNTSVRLNEVEEDCEEEVLQETSAQVKTGQIEVPECVTDAVRKEHAAFDTKTDVDVVKSADNTLHHQRLDHREQQQEQEQSDSDASAQTENSVASEGGNVATTEQRGARDNDQGGTDDDNSNQQMEKDDEEYLEAETRPAPERQLETVEDFTDGQIESAESGDVEHPVKDLTKTDIPGLETGASVWNPSCDDQVPLQLSRALPPPAAMLFLGDGPPVAVIRVTCGERRAEFHVDRLADGLGPVSNSIGTSRTSLCVKTIDDGDGGGGDNGIWMTPNQFQRASGRGTARDWKRSIKHYGVSLKSLLAKAVLSFDTACPGCRCNVCTVSVSSQTTFHHHRRRLLLYVVIFVDCDIVCLIVCSILYSSALILWCRCW